MHNVVNTLEPTYLIGSSSLFQETRTFLKSGKSSNLRQIGPRAALDHIEKFPWTYNGRNLINTLAPLLLIGSSSALQVTRTYMKAWMSSNFGIFATELWPLNDVRYLFLLNISKTNTPIKSKFCIHIIIDKIYVGIVNHCFLANLQQSYSPCLTSEFGFFFNILRTNKEIKTRFCIHIIIDMICVVVVNLCFSQICNRVTALD